MNILPAFGSVHVKGVVAVRVCFRSSRVKLVVADGGSDMHILIEGLQAVVAHSTYALRAYELCEARHGFAKSTQEVASN